MAAQNPGVPFWDLVRLSIYLSIYLSCSATLRQCSSLPFRLSATVSTSLTSGFIPFWGPTRIQIKNLHATSLHNSARIRSSDGFCDLGDMRLVVNVRSICIFFFVFIDLPVHAESIGSSNAPCLDQGYVGLLPAAFSSLTRACIAQTSIGTGNGDRKRREGVCTPREVYSRVFGPRM